MAADSLQNPTEPDATYRKKGHKSGIGYVMNVVEARDPEKEMSMIVYAERQPNIVSDSELGLNALDGDLKGVETLVSDGAYYSQEMVDVYKRQVLSHEKIRQILIQASDALKKTFDEKPSGARTADRCV